MVQRLSFSGSSVDEGEDKNGEESYRTAPVDKTTILIAIIN